MDFATYAKKLSDWAPVLWPCAVIGGFVVVKVVRDFRSKSDKLEPFRDIKNQAHSAKPLTNDGLR